MLKIHHLNCGTLCPFTGSTLVRKLPFLKDVASLVCHCLLVETKDSLVLIDTGLGLNDVHNSNRLYTSLLFGNFAKPLLDPKETAYWQIQKRGFKVADVTHIITTHLDCDHTGGLADFPNAQVHVLEQEWNAAFNDRGIPEKLRYFKEQYEHVKYWHRYRVQNGEKWNGFTGVRQLKNLPPEILMIPLPGHTHGHAGVVIEKEDGPLFFVGDAYLHRNQLLRKPPPLYVNLYNKFMQTNLELFNQNLERLSDLQDQKKGISIFCSHDPHEYLCLSRHERLEE